MVRSEILAGSELDPVSPLVFGVVPFLKYHQQVNGVLAGGTTACWTLLFAQQ